MALEWALANLQKDLLSRVFEPRTGEDQLGRQAYNEALVEAQFLRQALKEERRNAMERAWAQKTCTKVAKEAVTLKGKLRTVEKSIQSLKNTINKYG